MNQDKHYSISDVARMLGIQEYRVQYAHRTGKVPSPEIFAGRRAYTKADIQRLAQHFKVTLPKEEGGRCT